MPKNQYNSRWSDEDIQKWWQKIKDMPAPRLTIGYPVIDRLDKKHIILI